MNTKKWRAIDVIDGLIAVISGRKRERGEKQIGLTYRELAKGLQYLQDERGYELYLDFDVLNTGIYSKTLDDILFASGVFKGEVKESDRCYYTPSNKLMDRKVAELGDSYVEYIERMADDFEEYFKGKIEDDSMTSSN